MVNYIFKLINKKIYFFLNYKKIIKIYKKMSWRKPVNFNELFSYFTEKCVVCEDIHNAEMKDEEEFKEEEKLYEIDSDQQKITDFYRKPSLVRQKTASFSKEDDNDSNKENIPPKNNNSFIIIHNLHDNDNVSDIEELDEISLDIKFPDDIIKLSENVLDEEITYLNKHFEIKYPKPYYYYKRDPVNKNIVLMRYMNTLFSYREATIGGVPNLNERKRLIQKEHDDKLGFLITREEI